MKIKNTLFCFIILIKLCYSQELQNIRIVKILDSNLFLTEKGKFIKLAHINSPSLFSQDSLIAKKIIKYATVNFLKKPLSYQPENPEKEADTINVYLYREYDLETICFNQKYLELGFGKYISQSQLQSSQKFINSEENAKIDKIGIWQKEQIHFSRTHSIIFKYHNNFKGYNNYNKVTFRQFNYTLYKPNKLLQFSISRFFREYFGSESGENLNYYIISRFFANSNNLSINIGLCLSVDTGGESQETIYFPTLGIKYKFYDNFYIHSDFVDEDNLSLWNYGISYNFNHPYTEITVGRSLNIQNEWKYFINSRYAFLKLLQLQIQVNYNIDRKYRYYLFGIGLIINE